MRAKMYCVSAWQPSLLWEFSDPLFSGVVHTVHGRGEKNKLRIAEVLDGRAGNLNDEGFFSVIVFLFRKDD